MQGSLNDGMQFTAELYGVYGSREGQFPTQLSFRNLRTHILGSTSLFASLNFACFPSIIAVCRYNLVVIALK